MILNIISLVIDLLINDLILLRNEILRIFRSCICFIMLFKHIFSVFNIIE